MAQSFTVKQTTFVQNYATAVQGFLNCVDQLILLNAVFVNDTYGTGGAEAIPDAVVQAVLPAATAAIFNSAEGAITTILSTVASNRGYLGADEVLMPITRGTGTSVIASTGSTTTSSAQATSGNYVTEVLIDLVQVGTATTAAQVQIQLSPDGGTTYYSPGAFLVVFPLAAATTDAGPIQIPVTMTHWKAAFTQQSGGTSSTVVVQSNNVTGV